MPGTRLVVTIDRKMLNQVAFDVGDASAKRGAQRAVEKTRANIRSAGRVNTGALVKSVRIWNYGGKNLKERYAVGSSLPYAVYQEKGIGPVVAKPGKVLRFKPKGSGTFIFRPRTRGFPGAFFLRDAYRSLTLRDFLP